MSSDDYEQAENWPETRLIREKTFIDRQRVDDDLCSSGSCEGRYRRGGGFEALRGLIPSFFGSRDWNFQLKFDPGGEQDGCEEQATSSSSEVCQVDWVWRKLNEAVEANRVGGERSANRWNIIDDHVEKTRLHGWCAHPRGSLRLPLAVKGPDGVWRWDPTAPHDFDPYEEGMGRWFRTANDSALAQNGGRLRYFQGTVHPTFNAHIAYAEAVASALTAAAGPE